MLGNVESWVLGGEEDPCRPLNIDNQLKTRDFVILATPGERAASR